MTRPFLSSVKSVACKTKSCVLDLSFCISHLLDLGGHELFHGAMATKSRRVIAWKVIMTVRQLVSKEAGADAKQ